MRSKPRVATALYSGGLRSLLAIGERIPLTFDAFSTSLGPLLRARVPYVGDMASRLNCEDLSGGNKQERQSFDDVAVEGPGMLNVRFCLCFLFSQELALGLKPSK